MSARTPLDRVRAICLALPGATEKLSHGEPTWWVRGRMFAMFADAANHHGGGRPAVWVKAAAGAQDVLTGADSDRYFVPPYVGVNGWVGVRLDRRPEWPAVASIIEDGYRLLASRRQLLQLDASVAPTAPARRSAPAT